MAHQQPTGIKRRLQLFLAKLGLYHRVRQSLIYDSYWAIANGKLLRERKEEVEFYRELLKGRKEHDLIFDVGANHGQKTDVFLRLGAVVVAVEPDETNQKILRESFLKYRLKNKPVTIVGKAVGASNRTETMWIDEPGSAKNTLSTKWVDTLRTDSERFGRNLDFGTTRTVETTTLDSLIAAHGVPYFIKIDVEGYEPQVLAGLSQSVPFLSFEINLPEFRPEGIECVETLNRLNPKGRFNYVADSHPHLALAKWIGYAEFRAILETCQNRSIEVLWTST